MPCPLVGHCCIYTAVLYDTAVYIQYTVYIPVGTIIWVPTGGTLRYISLFHCHAHWWDTAVYIQLCCMTLLYIYSIQYIYQWAPLYGCPLVGRSGILAYFIAMPTGGTLLYIRAPTGGTLRFISLF